MFGLLYTGDAYKSQTEYLVLSAKTYLKLCYRSAAEIYELALENKEMLSFLMIKGWGTGLKNLERHKSGQRLEDKMGEMYEELITHSCTTKLYVTFSLESFINSFATYLINQRILNNVRDEVKEIILHNNSRLYDKMSTLDKWEEVAHQFGKSKLNKYTVLWKKFCNLYRYRDNMVHDKPIFILRTGDVIRVKKGIIAPVKREEIEPSTIAKYINDAYQACKVHDDMIKKIYVITGVPEEEEQVKFFILPRNYHRKIKNIIKKLEDLEQEIQEKATPFTKPEGYRELV